MNLSKLNRVTHRDLGYLIAGLAIIYAISGITLNHKNDWNSNYVFENRTFTTNIPVAKESFNDDIARELLKSIQPDAKFKTSYFPTGDKATIFIDGGFVQINTKTGEGLYQRISRRPILYQFNFLHYNPGKWWKYFSDIFCLALIVVTVTGMFIIKGKNGITKRGAILTIAGIILPLLFLFIY
ncbi:MAG TPA: PepSY-associated TM helix domain-containing protein [Bacteroidales bacterium]|nr:PepSY-associated TM helix domain-containing protein [Bacteroidales bacterium]